MRAFFYILSARNVGANGQRTIQPKRKRERELAPCPPPPRVHVYGGFSVLFCSPHVLSHFHYNCVLCARTRAQVCLHFVSRKADADFPVHVCVVRARVRGLCMRVADCSIRVAAVRMVPPQLGRRFPRYVCITQRWRATKMKTVAPAPIHFVIMFVVAMQAAD